MVQLSTTLYFDKEDFGKDMVEAFLDSSLEGLPKEAIITDGAPMYKDILKKMGVKHQICIFHVIKIHHTPSFKNIKRLTRRINTINKQISSNKTTIEMLTEQIKKDNLTKKKKDKKRTKIKKLDENNKKSAKRTKREKSKT